MALDSETAVKVVLSLARDKGVTELTKTALVKYLYLLDVYSSEMLEGAQKATDLEWRFIHFGPHSNQLEPVLTGLQASGAVSTRGLHNEDGEVTGNLLQLSQNVRLPNLKDFGLPSYITLRLGSDIQRFRNRLGDLLNYVYFKTEPMNGATPGSTLDFSHCYKKVISDFSIPKTVPLSSEKKTRANAILEKMVSRAKDKGSKRKKPRYDDVYYQGLSELGLAASPLDVGLQGVAEIKDD